jgi:crotonobetainyl-CoA:carnitine CoA-transferase CaiB-like acyl-CoA transferase
MLATPGYLDGVPSRATGPAPRLGEHTLPVLREAGYDDDAIAALRATRAAIAAEPVDDAAA